MSVMWCLRIEGYDSQAQDQTVDSVLRTTDCGPRTTDYGLPCWLTFLGLKPQNQNHSSENDRRLAVKGKRDEQGLHKRSYCAQLVDCRPRRFAGRRNDQRQDRKREGQADRR